MAMDLGFVFAQKSQPKLNFHDYDITIAGRRGSGKSTLAIAFFRDVCCLIDVEDGNKQLDDVYKIVPRNWKEIKDLQKSWKKAIKEGHQPPFSVLLFDTQTKLALMCDDYVLKQNGWEDFTQGSDGVNRWNARKNEYDTVINGFKEMGFKIVFICHGKDKQIKLRGQEPYNQFVPDVGASFDYAVLGAVDFVFYLEKTRIENARGEKEEVRRLVLQNDLDYDVKCRFPELPDEIIYREAVEGVKAFHEAWEVAVNKKTPSKPQVEVAEVFVSKPEPAPVKEEPVKETPVKSDPLPKSFDDEEDDLDIDELRTQAIAVRDKLMTEMETDEVKAILREELGKIKIANVDDVEALKAFIAKHE